jgi:hypothetical protein
MIEKPYTVIVRLPLLVVGPGRHANSASDAVSKNIAIPIRTIYQTSLQIQKEAVKHTRRHSLLCRAKVSFFVIAYEVS